jgi:hypothetical protein
VTQKQYPRAEVPLAQEGIDYLGFRFGTIGKVLTRRPSMHTTAMTRQEATACPPSATLILPSADRFRFSSSYPVSELLKFFKLLGQCLNGDKEQTNDRKPECGYSYAPLNSVHNTTTLVRNCDLVFH